MLTEQVLRKGLKTKIFGNKIYAFESIDSTNNCAKAVAGCGAEEGVVVIADHQTAGRGRLGRPWQDNPGENLTFSLVIRPRIEIGQLNLLSLFVSVAVSQAIERTTGVRPECKWPNDLLINGRKIAGILIESSIKSNYAEFVLIGIGVNVNQTRFSPDLSSTATSLSLLTKTQVDRALIFQEILSSLELNYMALRAQGFHSILPSWLSRSTMVNKRIAVSENGNVIEGIVTGLNKEGALMLRTPNAERALYAGDVTILRI